MRRAAHFSMRTVLIFAVVGLVLVLAVGGLVFKGRQPAARVADGQKAGTAVSIASRVAQLYMVPTGEQPTVAKIQDKSKLPTQTFFNNAQNGDYLLVYKKAGLALIYRERVNRLVNAGPVSLTGQTAGASTETGN